MWATGQPFARRWAHETPGGEGARFRRLPERAPSTKAEPAENAASGAPRKKMTPAEVARHAALVRWKKKNPLMARQMAIREKRKAKGAPAPERQAAPPANGDERTKFLADLGLDANVAEALSEYLGGLADGEEMALNAAAAEALQAMGLAAMREGDGPNREIDLTAAGKKLAAAVARGDTARAMALVEKAHARAKPKGEAGAPGKEGEEKQPKGGGGGGGGGKEEKDKDAEKQQRAAETAGKVGLAAEDADDLRAAAESGGVQNKKLIDLGLVGEDGTTTDQGRRALSALERGDVRGYRAALQDVEAARGRAREKADRDAQRGAEREAREAEREKARAEREQERADRDAAREKAKADAEAQELDDLADDFRRGRRGLSFEQQRRLIRAGRARMNGEKFELKGQTAQERAMFANMGSSGGGGGGGKPTGGTGGLWKRGPDGKRTPEAGVQTPKPAAGGAKPGAKEDQDAAAASTVRRAEDGGVFSRSLQNDDQLFQETSREAYREYIERLNADSFRSENVNIRSLVAEAPRGFEADRVRRFMNEQEIRTDTAPAVLRYRGTDYLMDGHHRALSRIALGQDTIMARVVDVSDVEAAPQGVMLPRRPRAAKALLALTLDLLELDQ